MSTYLFAWNPRKWHWRNIREQIDEIAERGHFDDGWSCARIRVLPAGSRAFLIRLGDTQRGIVGSGYTTSDPETRLHWDDDRAARGDTTEYVDIRFDFLSEEPLITWDELNQPPLASFHWATQRSGVRIPDDLARQLEALWSSKLGAPVDSPHPPLPPASRFREGRRHTVTLDRYERDPRARQACIAYHGARCMICGVSLRDTYGPIAAGYIHVHHLNPFSRLAKVRRVDPAAGLIPICPNCHTIVHLKKPPLKPSQVRRLLRRDGRSTSRTDG